MRLRRRSPSSIDHQHAGRLGEQIDAAGERRARRARRRRRPRRRYSAAASSSRHVAGSSRATTISATPAAASAAISSGADQRCLSSAPGRPGGCECTATRADRVARRHGPNFMPALAPRQLRHAQRAVISAMIDDRDFRRRHRADSRARSAHGCARGCVVERPAAFSRSTPPAHASSASRARRCRSSRAASACEQRRIVDLRIVRQRDERGVAIDAERRQRHIRPFGDQRHVGKALRRRKRGARIDDRSRRSRASSPSAPAPG